MISFGRIASVSISLEEAWKLSLELPSIRDVFESQAEAFNWSHDFEFGPFWAYWFTRNVILDRWFVAEELIQTDDDVFKLYNNLISNYKSMGILGWTTQDDPEFEFDSNGRIVKHKVMLIRDEMQFNGLRDSPSDRVAELAAHADKIAGIMDAYRRQKKSQN